MNSEIIKSYLVGLSWDIDSAGKNRFEDALRVGAQQVTKFTSGSARGFAEMGAVAITALTGIATTTVALMDSVASGDLQMQLFARRMYMSLPAAREYKMALDALGASAEDVIWGPPEMRERYQQLIADNRRMMSGMGMMDFETQMRKIRDVRFQFTRMRQEGQLFVMGLVKDLSKGLGGDENSILIKLMGWNKWFIDNAPILRQKFSVYLIPVLRDTFRILQDIGYIAEVGLNSLVKFLGSLYDDPRLKDQSVSLWERSAIALNHVADSIQHIFDKLAAGAAFVDRHPWAAQIVGGAIGGAAIGSFIPGVGTAVGAALGAAAGAANQAINSVQGSGAYRDWQASAMSSQQWHKYAIQSAQKYGLDPGLFMAMIDRESGWNPYAKNPTSTATGFGQFLEQNWGMYGQNALDPFQNMDMSAHYLSDLTRQYGSASEALRYYGPSAGEQPAYQNYIMRRREQYNEAIGAGAYGNVTVNIYPQTNDPKEHARLFVDEMKKQSQRQQVQANPVFVTP